MTCAVYGMQTRVGVRTKKPLQTVAGLRTLPCPPDDNLKGTRTCPLLKGMIEWTRKLYILVIIVTLVTFIYWMSTARVGVPNLLAGTPSMCLGQVKKETITHLNGTKHLLISAYADKRVPDKDVRIIGIFKRDAGEQLDCIFCCQGSLSSLSSATVLLHGSHFGFPYVSTAVLCQTPAGCRGSHVALVPAKQGADMGNLTWLPVRNRKEMEQEERRFNLTVCISVMYGNINNVLQVAQTLEMYRLLGVNKVVVYYISSGPELGRLLNIYNQEGFVEIVPWPIDRHLKPSSGWRFSKSGGDLHYYGQLVTLNECIYRSMERSRYVLLNDLDEIIMPYRHQDLMSMMSELQQRHPDVSEFRIQAHRFPTKSVEPNGTFKLPQWEGLPGLNILQYIYRKKPTSLHLSKMIILPRLVEQTSVHSVTKQFGKKYSVPEDVCRVIHFNDPETLTELRVDRRLWDFQEKLISSVDRVLKGAGLIKV
ncbi:beta-1,4-galactosyltransferase galt-1-like isoform X2 [Festucalex cinctus]